LWNWQNSLQVKPQAQAVELAANFEAGLALGLLGVEVVQTELPIL
jgi:hypothetical protein